MPRIPVLLILTLALSLPSWLQADETAVSPQVLSQIQTLQAEKNARTPVQLKIASQVLYQVKKQRGESLGAGLDAMQAGIKVDPSGMQQVDIVCNVTPDLLAALSALGAQVIANTPHFHQIRASVPLASMEALAARPEVQAIRKPARYFTHAGSVTSEGDVALQADQVRAQLHATGRNVKVGVISDSADFYAASQITGDLGPVTILPGQGFILSGGTGEGTAMMEIVHDVAPDAQIYFASGAVSEASFAQNILDLRAAGCDIIMDDLGYSDESPFQDGMIAQAVNEVSRDGALYFSAEGNEGSQLDHTSGTWEGDFVDGGATQAPITAVGRVHRFGGANFDTIISSGEFTVLNWSDPLGGSANDYDLYLLDATGTQVLDASTDVQNGTQDPIEGFDSSSAGSRIVVVKANSAAPRYLRVISYRGELNNSTPSSVFGHPAAAGAIGVAAVNASAGRLFNSSFHVEQFSSDGPRHIFFYPDGTEITPGNLSSTGGMLRPSPLIAAADGVTTSVPGFAPFFGTSAATPHAGAVAALIWSRNRALTAPQVFSAMSSTAFDIEGTGFDVLSGNGLINALAAANSVTGTPLISLQGSAITSESFSPANGVLDPGETISFTVTLRNDGPVATTDLVATLGAQPGVSNPPGAVDFGVIPAGGTGTQTFTFRGDAVLASTVNVQISLADSGLALGSVTVPFTTGTFGPPQSFSNGDFVVVNGEGDATPYPSTIFVSGFTGTVGKVTATLNGLSSPLPAYLGVLVTAPSGNATLLMDAAGGLDSVSGLNLTFDDSAANAIPDESVTSGTYRPAEYFDDFANTSFDFPAPGAPYSLSMANLAAGSPNGLWSFYLRDSGSPFTSTISGGLTVTLTPVTAVPSDPGVDVAVASSVDENVAAVGDTVTLTVHVFNFGATAAGVTQLTDVLPSQFRVFSATADQGSVNTSSNAVTLTLPSLASQGQATLTILAVANTAGTGNNVATGSVAGVDAIPANNISTLPLTVAKPNLAFFRPANWSSPAIIATSPGSTSNGNRFLSSDSLYLNFAYTNNGAVTARGFFNVDVFLDGRLIETLAHELPFLAGSTRLITDVPLGKLIPGTHNVVIKLDNDGEIQETTEGDNFFTRIITVTGAGPNLAANTPAGSSGSIVLATALGQTQDSALINAGTPVYLTFSAINNGVPATGVATTAGVTVDNVPIASASIPLLTPNQAITVPDIPLGAFTSGTHIVRIMLDDQQLVSESNEGDNLLERVFVVNGLPTVSSIADLSFPENSSGTVNLTVGDAETPPGNLLVSFATSNPALFPTDGFVVSGTGAMRTVTIVPAQNMSGSGTVTVTVDDGMGGRDSVTFNVTVTPVNTPPTISTIADVTTDEDVAPTVTFTVGDLDTPASALSVFGTSSNLALVAADGFEFGGSGANRTVKLHLVPNASGTAMITVSVLDSGGVTAQTSFNLTVNAVNDPPTIDGPTSGSTLENVPATLPDFTVGDIESNVEDLVLSATSSDARIVPPTGIAISGTAATRTVQITPAPNANGAVQITVTVADPQGATTSQVVAFTVTPVNQPPTLTPIANVSVPKHGTLAPIAFNMGDVETAAGSLLVTAQSSNQSVVPNAGLVLGGSGALRTIQVTPADHISGSAMITISVFDGDLTTSSAFMVTVTPVNDPPTFMLSGDLSVAQDTGLERFPNFVSAISPGGPDEAAQTVSFTAVAVNPGLFLVPPSINPSGELSVTPSPVATGSSLVTVIATDSAGGSSAPQTFTINVTSFVAEAGDYHGLVLADEPRSASHTGRLNLSFNRAGHASGTLILAGDATPFLGKVANDGQVNFGAKGANASLHLPHGLALTLQVDVSTGSGQVTGRILDSSSQQVAHVIAERSFYDAKHPLPAAMRGNYTALFLARTPEVQGLLSPQFPQGNGAGVLHVSATGAVQTIGYLPDGRGARTSGGVLSAANRLPLFFMDDAHRETVGGFVTFADVPAVSDASGTGLAWFKPAHHTGLYRSGWPTGIELDFSASKFVSSRNLLAPLGAAPTILFQNGGLPPAGLSDTVLPANGMLHRSTNAATDKFQLRVGTTRGWLTGGFDLPGTAQRVHFRGVLFQKQQIGSGYFVGKTEVGGLSLGAAAQTNQ